MMYGSLPYRFITPHVSGRLGASREEQVETGRLCEGAEIAVARDERNVSVDAALRDQPISQPGLAALCKRFRTQRPGTLPVASFNLHHWHLAKSRGSIRGELR